MRKRPHYFIPLLSAFLWSPLVLLAPSGFAQVVVGPPRILPTTTDSRTQQAPGSPGSLSSIKSVLQKHGPLMQLGPVAFRPYINCSIEYGDGILRVPGEPVNSTMQILTQGLLIEMGSSWVLDGSLSRSIYSSRLLEDTYDSSVRLIGRWSWQDWTFGAAQAYTSNSPIVVETGGQNTERVNQTSATASYILGMKATAEINASWSERLASPKFQNASWTGTDWMQSTISSWFNYQATEKVSFSAGFVIGEDDLKLGDDMSYTQPQVRVRWRPTARWIIGVSGGEERRKVHGERGRNSNNPVYDATITYSPTLTTTLSVGMSQDVANSYFNDQTIKGTQWTASLGQRLLQRIFLNVGATRGTSKYATTTAFSFTDRDDEYQAYNASLSTAFLRRGSVSLSYGYSRNFSNTPGFRYSSRQIGADIGYRF